MTVPTGGEAKVVSYHERTPLVYTYGLEAFDYVQGAGEPSCYFRDAQSTGYYQAVAPSVLQANRWTHLACTFDGAAIRIYIDGTAVTTLPAPSTIPFMSGSQPELIVGTDSAGDETYMGMVDDVRVWGRALSASEVVDAMNAPVTP